MSASFTTLELTFDGAIARIWLNRPELRNAFDDVVIRELSEAFSQAGAANEVRVIVLGANGPAFCAGANLNWMRRAAEFTHEQNLADAGGLAEMLRTIHESPKPVIARVQGDVYAGGMGLVAACDVAVSVDTAWYCLSEVKIGERILKASGVRDTNHTSRADRRGVTWASRSRFPFALAPRSTASTAAWRGWPCCG